MRQHNDDVAEKDVKRVCETKGGYVTVHFRLHALKSHYRHRLSYSVFRKLGSWKVVWIGAIKSLEGILIYSEYRKDKIVNGEFKVSCKPQIRKAEVKCRHKLSAATTTASPFSRSAVLTRQICGEPAPVCHCHPAEWEWTLEATIEMNQIHHCLQGRGAKQYSLMHQRGGLRWLQRIQATPLHENCIDFIIAWSCGLKYDHLSLEQSSVSW